MEKKRYRVKLPHHRLDEPPKYESSSEEEEPVPVKPKRPEIFHLTKHPD